MSVHWPAIYYMKASAVVTFTHLLNNLRYVTMATNGGIVQRLEVT